MAQGDYPPSAALDNTVARQLRNLNVQRYAISHRNLGDGNGHHGPGDWWFYLPVHRNYNYRGADLFNSQLRDCRSCQSIGETTCLLPLNIQALTGLLSSAMSKNVSETKRFSII